MVCYRPKVYNSGRGVRYFSPGHFITQREFLPFYFLNPLAIADSSPRIFRVLNSLNTENQKDGVSAPGFHSPFNSVTIPFLPFP